MVGLGMIFHEIAGKLQGDRSRRTEMTEKTDQAPKRKTSWPPWCLSCCTMHRPGGHCPGEILATGVERHGWRVVTQDKLSTRVIGTLIAPAGDRWRARIITYPKILWVIPRGGTMKFLGPTAAQAEQNAVDYIIDHCNSRGITLHKEVPHVDSERVDPEQEPHATDGLEDSRRTLKSVAIRYGTDATDRSAMTGDLSRAGLFIVTPDPLARGTALKLFIRVAGFGVPLKGTVQWTRSSDTLSDSRPQ